MLRRIGSKSLLLSIALTIVGAMWAEISAAESVCETRTVASAPYVWSLPPGFPQPRVPADNPMSAAKVELGRRLFFDTRLSVTGTFSCASCHRPELAFTDGRTHAVGATGESLRRNSMSLTNVAYNLSFTWSSRAITTLEAQMRTPLFGQHPVEMGLLEKTQQQLTLLASDASYVQAFCAAFPQAANLKSVITIDNVIKAIATFERTLISGRSAFDRYTFDDQRDALNASARRGMELFFSERVGCVRCHSGINFSGPIQFEGSQNSEAIFANTGLYDIDGKGAYPARDNGLIEETRKREDAGRFRVPTLRNVALTGPYMHDGSVESLEEVLDHYAAGGRASLVLQPSGQFVAVENPRADSRKDKLIRKLSLTLDEKRDLIEFLRSLTDEDVLQIPGG